MTPRILFNETELPDMYAGCSSFEMMDLLYSKAEDFYASIPDVEYEEPVIAIAEISDGCGNVVPACWELSGHMLSACFEPLDSYHEFYIDQGGDLHSTGIDLRNGKSSYLFRVFKSGICRDEQQWLIDLINSSNELGDDLREEIDRCTLPVGIDFEAAGIA